MAQLSTYLGEQIGAELQHLADTDENQFHDAFSIVADLLDVETIPSIHALIWNGEQTVDTNNIVDGNNEEGGDSPQDCSCQGGVRLPANQERLSMPCR